MATAEAPGRLTPWVPPAPIQAARQAWTTLRSPSGCEAFAALLDLADADAFAARAYRRAAGTVRETPARVEELVRAGRVRELKGIGPGIARRLEELVETGHIAELDELEREIRPELVGLGRLIGLGPKRMLEVAAALGVQTADEFRAAALAGGLRDVRGIGPATEQKVLDRLRRGPEAQPRRGSCCRRRASWRAASPRRSAARSRATRAAGSTLPGSSPSSSRRPSPSRCSTRSSGSRRSSP